jgi:hypothetical protein
MQYLLYIRTYLLSILSERYTQELRKFHEDDLEDQRSVPFNPDVSYVVEALCMEGMWRYRLFLLTIVSS